MLLCHFQKFDFSDFIKMTYTYILWKTFFKTDFSEVFIKLYYNKILQCRNFSPESPFSVPIIFSAVFYGERDI